MDGLLSQLGELWGASGLIIGFLVMAVGYLYRRVESLQKDNIDTLKLILPMIEKFEVSMNASLRAVSKRGNEE